MRTDLKSPCSQCPFRSDIPVFLTLGRAREIVAHMDGVFPCHKTVDNDEGDVPKVFAPPPTAQHCAGHLILQLKEENLGQMARIFARTGWDYKAMDMNAPVYASREEFIEAHIQERVKARKKGKRRGQT